MRLLSHQLLRVANVESELEELMVSRSFSKDEEDGGLAWYSRPEMGKNGEDLRVQVNKQSGKWVAYIGDQQIMAGHNLQDLHRLTNTYGD